MTIHPIIAHLNGCLRTACLPKQQPPHTRFHLVRVVYYNARPLPPWLWCGVIQCVLSPTLVAESCTTMHHLPPWWQCGVLQCMPLLPWWRCGVLQCTPSPTLVAVWCTTVHTLSNPGGDSVYYNACPLPPWWRCGVLQCAFSGCNRKQVPPSGVE